MLFEPAITAMSEVASCLPGLQCIERLTYRASRLYPGSRPLDGHRRSHALQAHARKQRSIHTPVSRDLEKGPLPTGRVAIQGSHGGVCPSHLRTPTSCCRAHPPQYSTTL